MSHIPMLLRDLIYIFIVAAPTTILFKKIKQPLVLGYLIAGLIVGPNLNFFPTIQDQAGIKVWAELGVIFLLFGVGLEFSFKKMANVGRSASIIALFEVIMMVAIGYTLGKLFGWSRMDRFFLGGVLAISSTTIIVKAFEDLQIRTKHFVHLVFGILIVEDLLAILILVLLTTLASTHALSGYELLMTALKIVFFLTSWFVGGIYLVPMVINHLKKTLNEETILVLSVALCLVMVYLSDAIGFPPALGAFVMGSILAETAIIKNIEHVFKPVKMMFSAIFFVSVGMLINPEIIFANFPIILLLFFVTIFGKFISTSIGSLLAGESVKHSIKAGLGLSQIGEFSFIIAALGVTLKVTSEFIYPIAVALSVLTTFTTPYQIKYSDAISNWIEERIPKKVQYNLNRYYVAMRYTPSKNIFLVFLKGYGLKTAINGVVIVMIGLVINLYLVPYLLSHFSNVGVVRLASALLSILLAMPFFWPIIESKPKKDLELAIPAHSFQFLFVILKAIIVFVLICLVVKNFYFLFSVQGIILILISHILMYFIKYFGPIYSALEGRFIHNLDSCESSEEDGFTHPLLPWNYNLISFTVSPYSHLAFVKISETKIKEKYGVTIIVLTRGAKSFSPPDAEMVILPYDKVYVLGDEDKMEPLKNILEAPLVEQEEKHSNFVLESILVTAQMDLVGKSIKECGIRNQINGLIVGVEKNGKRIIAPPSNLIIETDDVLWIVGDSELLKRFLK